jgi:hypothetical protein
MHTECPTRGSGENFFRSITPDHCICAVLSTCRSAEIFKRSMPQCIYCIKALSTTRTFFFENLYLLSRAPRCRPPTPQDCHLAESSCNALHAGTVAGGKGREWGASYIIMCVCVCVCVGAGMGAQNGV